MSLQRPPRRDRLSRRPPVSWLNRDPYDYRALASEPLEERCLLTVSSHFADGLLSFTGDSAANLVEVRSSNDGIANTIEYNLGAGFVSQSGVTAISFQDAGQNDALQIGGNSTLASLSVDSNVLVRLSGSLLATGELSVAARSIETKAVIVAAGVELLGHYDFEMRSGTIRSDGGVISIGASQFGSTTISGSINASTDFGSGKSGGTIHVQGKAIKLDGARISADGDTGGGTVLLGGGLQGHGPFASSQRTTVMGNSFISASSLTAGDGGFVVVWGEVSTQISNSFFYARGGVVSGNGGLIETSGLQSLSIVNAPVSASSPHGLPGTWLLDPLDVTIDNLPTTNINPGVIFTPTATGAILNAAFVQTTLSNGTSISVASSGDPGGEAGNINVNVPLTRTNLSPVVPTLTLTAFNDVNVNQAIQGSAGAPLNIILASGAAGKVNVAAAINTFGGTFESSGFELENTVAGSITASTIDISQAGPVDIAGNLTATTSLSIHAGTVPAGGNLAFIGTPSLNSPTISLQAGPSAATTSSITIGAATFRGAAGGATSPAAFSFRQDAAIADTALPAVAQFGSGVPSEYSITSDGGAISLASVATTAKLLNSQLKLTGVSTTISVPLELTSLEVTNPVTLSVAAPTIAVKTSSFQLYNGAVTLAANTALESTSAGNITFKSTVNSDATARGLAVNTAGNEIFEGKVGVTAALSQLLTDSNVGAGLGLGKTIFNVAGSTNASPSVRTIGVQTYNDAVELQQHAVLESTASGNITFQLTVDSSSGVARELRVNTGGNEVFNGRVGFVFALAQLLTDNNVAVGLGKTQFNVASSTNASPSVRTTGAQSYNDAVELQQHTVLESTASGDIAFQLTVDSGIGGARDLRVNTGGSEVFSGKVGLGNALSQLLTDSHVGPGLGLGKTVFNAAASTNGSPSVRTNGLQTYNDAVELQQNTVLESTSSGNLTFQLTVDSDATPRELRVNTAGNELFNGKVGVTSALAQLLTDSSVGPGLGLGKAIFNVAASTNGSPSVRTTGLQTYNDAVELQQNTVLESTTSGHITFQLTVDSDATPRELRVNAIGNEVFNGKVGVSSALAQLLIDSNVGAGLGLGKTILNVAASTNGSPSVRTTGLQTYNDAVELQLDTVLQSTASGNITLQLTVDSGGTPRDLRVNTSGNEVFNGKVGVTSALAQLLTDSNVGAGLGLGKTIFNASASTNASPSVRTTGLQTYNSAIELQQNTVLESTAAGNITFQLTIDSDATPRELRVNTAGSELFNGKVGVTSAVAQLLTDSNVGAGLGLGKTIFNIAGSTNASPSVRSTGLQTYNDAVELQQNTVLESTSSGNITFQLTVDSDATSRELRVNTGGNQVFNGKVGVTSALAQLLTDSNVGAGLGTGKTIFNVPGTSNASPSVRTTGLQTYNDAVELQQNTVLESTSSGHVTFQLTIDSDATPRELRVNTSGNEIFNGKVGVASALAQLLTDSNVGAGLGAGKTIFNATGSANGSPSVRTTGLQTYNDTVELQQNTVLESTTLGNITFQLTVDSDATPRELRVNTSGNEIFNGKVGVASALAQLLTDSNVGAGLGAGKTIFNVAGSSNASPSVRTTGLQTYNDAVELQLTTVLESTASGNITFQLTVDSDATPRELRVNSSGNEVFNGKVGVTSALTQLLTDSNVGAGLGAGKTIFNVPASTNGSPSVRTTGLQTYNDAVELQQNTVLESNASGNITFQLTVDSDATPRELRVNTSGNEVFNGKVGVTAALAQLLTDSNVGAGLGSGKTIFNIVASSNVSPSVRTTGLQTYNDAVELQQNAVLESTSSGNITFQQSVDSDATPRELRVNTSGDEVFNGKVGVGSPLAQLLTDSNVGAGLGVGKTIFNVAASSNASPSVRTTGLQTYNDAVELQQNTVLESTASGNITFQLTVDSDATPRELRVNTGGNQVFNGKVGVASALAQLLIDSNVAAGLGVGNTIFNVTGTTNGSPSVRTTGLQTYNDAVELQQNTVLESTLSGNITFQLTLDSDATPREMRVNTGGNEVFNGKVGVSSPLALLLTDSNVAAGLGLGKAIFNIASSTNGSPSVRTTGLQAYNDAVELQQNTVLESTASGNVTFQLTVDSDATPRELRVNTAGNEVFNGKVGVTSALAQLLTDSHVGAGLGLGKTIFNVAASTNASPSVRTTGLQTYNDAVELQQNTVLESTSSGHITFQLTVDSDATPRELRVNTTGNEVFNGKVGVASALAQLLTDSSVGPGLGAGKTIFNVAGSTNASPSVRTTGLQTYNDAVELQQNTVLESTSSGHITFQLTVDSDATPRELRVNTTGNQLFNGKVGVGSALAQLLTDSNVGAGLGSGKTIFNIAGSTNASPSVRTTGLQTYNDAVELQQNTVLESTAAGNITFQLTVDSDATPRELRVNSAGNEVFNGKVGVSSALAQLLTDSSAGAGLGLGKTIFNVAGSTNGSPSVRTTGLQTYNDAVELQQNTVLESTAAGNITFQLTVDSDATPRELRVNSAGNEVFNGKVGVGSALAQLLTDSSVGAGLGAGKTIFNVAASTNASPSVRTTGLQAYNDAVELHQNTVLESTAAGNITFYLTVDSDATPRELRVNTGGNEVFNAKVGVTNALAHLLTDSNLGVGLGLGKTIFNVAGSTSVSPSVRTTGDQIYNDAVELQQDTVLTAGGAITFHRTVGTTGLFDLTLRAAGTTTINGAVTGVDALLSNNGDVTLVNAAISAVSVQMDDDSTLNVLAPLVAVTTTAGQTYNGAVTLAQDTIVTAGTAGTPQSIAFNNTIDGTTDGNQGLTVNANVTFSGSVGWGVGKRLEYLTVNWGTTIFNVNPAAGPSLPPKNGVNTRLAQVYGPVILHKDTSLTAGIKPIADTPGTITYLSTVSTIATAGGPFGLSSDSSGLTTFNGTVGGGVPLKFLDVHSAGPFQVNVDMTTNSNLSLNVTRSANPATSNDTLRIGNAAVAKVMSNLGDVLLLADNDIELLANSIVEATQGNVFIKGDASNNSPTGSTITLQGRINAPATGRSIQIEGNTHNDVIVLDDNPTAVPAQLASNNSPTVNIFGIGGRDTVTVKRTNNTTLGTNIYGGDQAVTGNNLTVNLGGSTGSLSALKGNVTIQGSPYASLPSDTRNMVTYDSFAVPAGNPPQAALTAAQRPALNTTAEKIGNSVNLVDSGRTEDAFNHYWIFGNAFFRTEVAQIALVNDGVHAIQSLSLDAANRGNNEIDVTLPEGNAARPLVMLDIDGGFTPGVATTNVLCVTGALNSNQTLTGNINGENVVFSTIIAGDKNHPVDTPPGAVQPIGFSHIRSLYLHGTSEADFIVNNSWNANPTTHPTDPGVFTVMDGNGGGDWMMTGGGDFAQDVLFGGGAPANRPVFMIGRGTGQNILDLNLVNGYFFPNYDLETGNSVSYAGTSYLEASRGTTGASYSFISTSTLSNGVFATGGFLGQISFIKGQVDIMTWLRASLPGAQNIFARARNLIDLFPKCD